MWRFVSGTHAQRRASFNQHDSYTHKWLKHTCMYPFASQPTYSLWCNTLTITLKYRNVHSHIHIHVCREGIFWSDRHLKAPSCINWSFCVTKDLLKNTLTDLKGTSAHTNKHTQVCRYTHTDTRQHTRILADTHRLTHAYLATAKHTCRHTHGLLYL